MKPKNLKSIIIESVKSWITDVDDKKLREEFVRDVIGFRRSQLGGVARRDEGTRHVFPTYPQGTIVGNEWLYIATEEREYCILAVNDPNTNLRIYVRPVDLATDWEELSRALICTVSGTPGATSLTATLTGITDINGNATTLTTNEIQYWIAYNVTRANAQFITSATPTVITGETYFGAPPSGTLGWQTGDHVVLYKCQGVADIDLGTIQSSPSTSNFFKQGATPHIQWLKTPELNKVNLYFGNSNESPTMQYPIRIQKGVNTITPSVITGSRYKFNTRSSWYIDLAETTPVCKILGSAGIPILANAADSTTELGEGMSVTFFPDPGFGSAKYHRRGYLTLLYRAKDNSSFYQESDPIFKFYLSPTTATMPDFELDLNLDLSRLSKSVAGCRLYTASKADSDIDGNLALWFDNDASEFRAVPDADASTVAIVNISQHLFDAPLFGNLSKGGGASRYVYTHRFFQATTVDYNAMNETLLGNLGHAPDMNRTRLKPRFAAKMQLKQGSKIIADANDREARTSCYSGAGVHMDDSFPDITADDAGYLQKFDISVEGNLYNLRFSLNRVVVFKENSLQLLDIQSSGTAGDYVRFGDDRIKADVASKRGIVEGHDGLYWLGHNGAYFKPHGSSEVVDISLNKIRNFISGDLLTDDGTPFCKPEYRKLAVGGHDPFFNQIRWSMTVSIDVSRTEIINLIYDISTSTWWKRKIKIVNDTQAVAAFAERKDNTLSIATEGAVLQYPNIDTDFPYQDFVASDDASGGEGIETSLLFNLGTLYNQVPNGALVWGVTIECDGESTTGREKFYIKFYPDESSRLCDPHKVPMDGNFQDRYIMFPKVGKVYNGWLQLYLPSESEQLFKNWQLSRIIVDYVPSMLKTG